MAHHFKIVQTRAFATLPVSLYILTQIMTFNFWEATIGLTGSSLNLEALLILTAMARCCGHSPVHVVLIILTVTKKEADVHL